MEYLGNLMLIMLAIIMGVCVYFLFSQGEAWIIENFFFIKVLDAVTILLCLFVGIYNMVKDVRRREHGSNNK